MPPTPSPAGPPLPRCPDPDCAAHHRAIAGAVVKNGRYVKKGRPAQRWRCRRCGRSFIADGVRVFPELYTEEEKILAALRLLAKGVSLRRAARLTQVRPDTVRRWLERAAARPQQVEAALSRYPGTSLAELRRLWKEFAAGRLRSRAVLWRRRTGWSKAGR